MSETENNQQGQKSKIDILATVKIAAVAVVFLLISALLWSVLFHLREYRRRIRCRENVIALGKTMVIYACGYDDKYPTAEKWCDLLLEYTEVSEKAFVCPSVEEGRCHYAMNPNADLTSLPEMVLLFETKGGWNQFGDLEILTFENHGGKGCNICSNNWNGRFVKPEQVGGLKWNVEERRK
jgi:hypothetical protein